MMRAPRHSHLVGCLLLTGAIALAGCAGPRSTRPAIADARGGDGFSFADDRAAERELVEAEQLIKDGEYSAVIPRLHHLINKYPKTTASLNGRYQLGVAYENIESYQDAITMFEEYLKLAPEGEYAEASVAYVKQLNAEYNEQFITPAELDQQVVALAEKLKADPGNASDQYELANLLWLRGDYDEAAKLYLALVQVHPEYAGDSLVMRRIEILPTGEYIVLTPAEVQRREIEREPLSVFNVSAFRSGPDLITRLPRFYVVTGQVVNRSDSVLYGVRVTTTLFGFGNTVYDTNSYSLGRMNPGEIRAFSMRFSNFENIENIYRHECIATFDR